MTPEQRAAVDRWLDELVPLSIDAATERLKECEDDVVRQEVASLLSFVREDQASSGTQQRGVLERGARELAPDLLASDTEPGTDRNSWIGRTLGSYRLVAELGHGGMGVVYRGERVTGDLEHQAAIKLLSVLDGGSQSRERFLQERQILAHLDHPGIARFLDGGYAPDGRPFLVLELVDGEPIDTFCQREQLGVRQTIELFLEVCDAVDHAHQRMVVHRDIKPSNLLVITGATAAAPQAPGLVRVKLLDFGIAKFLEGGSDEGDLTRHAQPLTPNYASPEQILGEPISAATDVFSLGTLLYQLLSGELPVERSNLSPEQLVAGARADTTEAPSTRLRATGVQTGKQRRLQGDLDAIVLKSIRSSPNDRYSSVREFASDLQAFLDGRPVEARRGNRWYVLRRFVSRNRTPLLVGATVLSLLVGGLIALASQVNRAEREKKSAEEIAEFSLGVLAMADVDAGYGAEFSAREMLELAADQLKERTGIAPEARHQLLRSIAGGFGNLRDWDRSGKVLETVLSVEPGLSDPQLRAESLQDLAQTHAERRQLATAVSLTGEAVELLQGLHGPDSVEVADVLAAQVYHQWLGAREPDATPWQAVLDGHRAIDIYRMQLGADSEPEAATLHFLASLVRLSLELGLGTEEQVEELGLCPAPVDCLRSALRIRESLGDKAGTARSMNDLALALDAMGEDLEATEILKRSWELHREILTESHPTTIAIHGNLAAMHNDIKQYEEARTLYQEVIRLFKATVGDDSPRLSSFEWGLGIAEEALGNSAAAIDLWSRAADREGYYPMRRAIIAVRLGELLVKEGRARDGEQRTLAGFKLAVDTYDESHPQVRDLAGRVARFYMDQGMTASAARFNAIASAPDE